MLENENLKESGTPQLNIGAVMCGSCKHWQNNGREYYRFTSKELMLFFIDFFGIEKGKAVYFDVDSTPNEKGMFKVVPSL